jgi:hypothetical protein
MTAWIGLALLAAPFVLLGAVVAFAVISLSHAQGPSVK